MTATSSSAVTITNQFHTFKSWSQLKNEAKGGYLEGLLHVPETVKKIELALYDKDGKDGNNGHPCLLFLTPHKKNSKEKPKDIKAEDYKVQLEINEDGDLEVLPLNYWPGKSSHDFLGPRAWDKNSRSLKLGSGGLNLTVVKPIEKIGENKNIDLEKMKEIRKITDLPEMTKVKLGATFDNHMTSTPELFVTCLDLSNIILDKSRWWIGVTDAPVKSICTQSEHIIYIKHNSNIKNQDQVELQLFKLHHDFQNGEIIASSTDFKINNSNKEIRFKMNMNDYLPEKLLDNDCPTFANLRVIRVDEDINPLSFDLEDINVNNENVKIKKHKPQDSEDYHECPCIENRDSVDKYDGQVQKLGQDLKRKNNDKLDVRSQKCMKTGNNPSLTYDDLLVTKILTNHADFFKNNFDAVISFGDRNLKIRWRLYSGGETEDTFFMKIGYWYQILYQEEANGECYVEEKELSLANFFCNPDHYKSIFSEKKRAFENLEYELITGPWSLVETVANNNNHAPSKDFDKFFFSGLNLDTFARPKDFLTQDLLINRLKLSANVKKRIENDDNLTCLETFIRNHILIGEDVWKKIHPEPLFSLSNIEVPEEWEVNIPQKPWEYIS